MTLESELVELLPQFVHREDVCSPKGISLTPLDELGNLLLGSLVEAQHKISYLGPCPQLRIRDPGHRVVAQNPVV